MKLACLGRPHLTYCTNIHPGETWEEVRRNLEHYVLLVKSRVAPDRPFGVGLRLSADAAKSLAAPLELESFVEFLRQHNLYVFTINGFPYGTFHGARVKEKVYLPDWLDEARLVYTDRLAALLAKLLPADHDLEGSLSTVPGAFKARVNGESDAARMAELMIRHVATLSRLREETGKTISLALEPEPCCYMETVRETVLFFERHLLTPAAAACLGRLTGLGLRDSEETLRRHLGVCLDACHMAVEFEDPGLALDAFRAAGIRIAKIQISAGLQVQLGVNDRETLHALRRFDDGVYLHQVVERRGDHVTRYVDLPHALAAAGPDDRGLREWRIHCHVPIFRDQFGIFRNTQGDLEALFAILRRTSLSRHLEVETYTWDVLPAEYRQEDMVTAVAREIQWASERMMS